MSLSKSAVLSQAYSALGRVPVCERSGVFDYELYCTLRGLLSGVSDSAFIDDVLSHAMSDAQVGWNASRVRAETLAIEMHSDEIRALVAGLPDSTLADMKHIHSLVQGLIKDTVLTLMPTYSTPPSW